MRILIAHDNTPARQNLLDELRRLRHEAREANTAVQAWEIWQQQPFTYVVVDANLPDADRLARQIRQASQPHYTYILFLNAKEDRAIKAGTAPFLDDYLPKNFSVPDFISHIRLGERILNLENRLTDTTAKANETGVRDPLTGLYNRKHFEERLEDEIQRALRYQRVLTLILVDIDHFKIYNEKSGHARGDALLRELTSLILSSVRRTDFVARYGGEEFMIVLPETPQSNALTLADNLRETVAAYPFPLREDLPNGMVTISLGVTSLPDDANDSASLLQTAEAALYRAKRRGRNKVMTPLPPAA